MLSVLAAGAHGETTVGIVTLLLSVGWCIYNPFVYAIAFLPFLVPFGKAQLVPGVEFTIFRGATLIALLAFATRPSAVAHAIRRLPPYLSYGAGGLLAGYAVSFVVNGFPAGGTQAIGVFATRVIQVTLVVVAFSILRAPRLLLFSLASTGFSILLGGLYVWQATGSITGARSLFVTAVDPGTGELYLITQFSFGTILGVALLLANSGVFAVPGGVASFALAQTVKSWFVRYFMMLMSLLIMLSSIASGRREAVVAIILVAAVPAIILRSRNALVGAVLILLAAAGAYAGGPLRDFLESRESVAEEFTGGGTGRFPLIIRSLELWAESPIVGYGPGTHARLLWSRSDLRAAGVAAHNSFTGVLVEAGLIGFVPLMFFFIGFLSSWRRAATISRRRADTRWPPMMLGGIASIIAVAFVGNFIHHSGYMLIFAALAAWCHVLEREHARRY